METSLLLLGCGAIFMYCRGSDLERDPRDERLSADRPRIMPGATFALPSLGLELLVVDTGAGGGMATEAAIAAADAAADGNIVPAVDAG